MAMAAASHMASLVPRRPNPPPTRVECTTTFSGGSFSIAATWFRPRVGAWVGDQISITPSWNQAVVFCGSSVAWHRKG